MTVILTEGDSASVCRGYTINCIGHTVNLAQADGFSHITHSGFVVVVYFIHVDIVSCSLFLDSFLWKWTSRHT